MNLCVVIILVFIIFILIRECVAFSLAFTGFKQFNGKLGRLQKKYGYV